MPETTQATSHPAWWRPRPTPVQPEPMHPPVWKSGRRPQPVRRGPWQKLGRIALAVAITAHVAFAATSAQAQERPHPDSYGEPDRSLTQDGCDVNSGPEGVTIGALRYVATVFEDAATKQEHYRRDPEYARRFRSQESVEMRNDFLCDVPADFQPTLEFMTMNLLVFVMDIMHM
jgi:hypothetical protein